MQNLINWGAGSDSTNQKPNYSQGYFGDQGELGVQAQTQGCGSNPTNPLG